MGPQGAAGLHYDVVAKVPPDSSTLPSALGRKRSRGFRRNTVGGRGAGALTQTLGEKPGSFGRVRSPSHLVNVPRAKKNPIESEKTPFPSAAEENHAA